MLSQATILAEGPTVTEILFLDTIPTLGLTLATVLGVIVAIRADNHMYKIVKQALSLIPLLIPVTRKKHKPETRGRHELVEDEEPVAPRSRLGRRLWWRHAKPTPVARQEIKGLENKLVDEIDKVLLK